MEPAEPKNMNQLPVGTTLGDFTITAAIGAGGFAIVYLAHDNALDRTVAIKEYLPAAIAGRADDHLVLPRSRADADAYGAGLASFILEAKLVARFSHSAVQSHWASPRTRGRTGTDSQGQGRQFAPSREHPGRMLFPKFC